MRYISLIVALTALPIAPAAAETRTLIGFDRISASASSDVEVTIGQSFSVNVQGAHPERVVTRVEGRTLVVEPVRDRGFHWRWAPGAVVHVTMPQVAGLEASSGADIRAEGVNAGELSLGASSGGEIRVAGACAALKVNVSSGADVHASELRCNEAEVHASSGADASIWVVGQLDVAGSSGADIHVTGAPILGSVSLSSGADLHRN